MQSPIHFKKKKTLHLIAITNHLKGKSVLNANQRSYKKFCKYLNRGTHAFMDI